MRDKGSKMIEHYTGTNGDLHLRDALAANRLVAGDQELARGLEPLVELVEFEPGDRVIDDHGTGRDLFLVLAGSLSVEAGGSVIADVWAGEFVGEMALIDRHTVRSAAVVACDECVLARVSEPDFSRLADHNPRLWRNLAIDLVRRLTDR